LIHNPLLKAYFLSEKHNRHLCSHASRGLAVGKPYLGTPDGGGGAVGPDREKGCMCCELDRAFEEVSKTPDRQRLTHSFTTMTRARSVQ
jgi:ubiquitin carboxyl-terminal hydrolase 22/27/51